MSRNGKLVHMTVKKHTIPPIHEKEFHGVVCVSVKEWIYGISGNKETLDLVIP